MQAGKDRMGATGEKQNCSTIYSQNQHTQEASSALNLKGTLVPSLSVQNLKSSMEIKKKHLLNVLDI